MRETASIGVILQEPHLQGALFQGFPPANRGDIRDTGLIPGSERSPGGGHGYSFQYSCLDNSIDRGA